MHVSKDLMWWRESKKTCNLNKALINGWAIFPSLVSCSPNPHFLPLLFFGVFADWFLGWLTLVCCERETLLISWISLTETHERTGCPPRRCIHRNSRWWRPSLGVMTHAALLLVHARARHCGWPGSRHASLMRVVGLCVLLMLVVGLRVPPSLMAGLNSQG